MPAPLCRPLDTLGPTFVRTRRSPRWEAHPHIDIEGWIVGQGFNLQVTGTNHLPAILQGVVRLSVLGGMVGPAQMDPIFLEFTPTFGEGSLDHWVNEVQVRPVADVVCKEDLFYCAHNAVRSAQLGGDTVPEGFHPLGDGGTVHERRQVLTWSLSPGVDWDDTDLST